MSTCIVYLFRHMKKYQYNKYKKSDKNYTYYIDNFSKGKVGGCSGNVYNFRVFGI